MSYARLSKGFSDVYVFATEWGVTCCWCALRDEDGPPMSYSRAIAHVIRHRLAGHKVPRGVEWEILKDGLNPSWRLDCLRGRREARRRAAEQQASAGCPSWLVPPIVKERLTQEGGEAEAKWLAEVRAAACVAYGCLESEFEP